MTQPTSPAKQPGFSDLRHQMAAQVGSANRLAEEASPSSDKTDKTSPATPRPTLHLPHAGQKRLEAADHPRSTKAAG